MEEYNKKFYEMTPAERLAQLAEQTSLDQSALDALSGADGLNLAQADHMIENVVGTYALPMGVAQHFLVNLHGAPGARRRRIRCFRNCSRDDRADASAGYPRPAAG